MIFGSYSMSPIVDVQDLLKGKQTKAANLKESLLSTMRSKYVVYQNENEYSDILDQVFENAPDRMTKAEVEIFLNDLNRKVRDGESENDHQDVVLETESDLSAT